ncbi:MAG: bis(5'-nucleosyl)-tetraphosphatase (symmetrical) YqeK [Oscillospiraceae bacterium]|jgi:predicted HD superfamily hydrolase involved in NAD metabolism|nr:bis(5'-nucleosyl)-tetraphosphatase (symmetrical) YqeK [Oscillospiraceae bacterium]
MYRRYELLRLLKTRLDEKRFLHSLAVERMAVRLAAAHGADWYRAGTAGLLHDIFKCGDKTLMLDYLGENGVRLGDDWLANPKLWHGVCGAVFLRRELGIRDSEILSAVRYHTTGHGRMGVLEKTVCVADVISEDRSYPELPKIRAAAVRNLDEALALTLGYGIAGAVKRGLPIVKECVEAYNNSLKAILSASNINSSITTGGYPDDAT